jgi:hypothetical protein
VRSIICVRESSDCGAVLDPKVYAPTGKLGARPRLGRGDRLILLQEMRSKRMSHFQLLKFKGGDAGPPSK